MHKSHRLAVAVLVGATMVGAFVLAKTGDQPASGHRMAGAAQDFLKSLTDEQRVQATFAYDDPERLNWHYIPRVRKGVPLKVMTPSARAAARSLIAGSLSDRGFEQVVNVMSLDDVLFLLEKGRLRRSPRTARPAQLLAQHLRQPVGPRCLGLAARGAPSLTELQRSRTAAWWRALRSFSAPTRH